MSPKRRGELLSFIARTSGVSGEKGACITDAEPGLCCNGKRRAAITAEYDWLCNGRRVECKSSMFQWLASQRRWYFKFHAIKFHSFDTLLLVLYTPLELIVYQHDLGFGVSSNGARTETEGYAIALSGPKDVSDWNIALISVIGKLDAPSNECRELARLPFDHPSVVSALESFKTSTYAARMGEAYHEVPLANGGHGVRGTRIQAIARVVDTVLNLGSSVMDPVVGVRLKGARRSMAQAEYDWIRDGQRIECKSSQLVWHSCRHTWRVRFRAIKPNSFDELLLCLYTPRGIFIYWHSGDLALSSNGVQTGTRGYDFSVSGERHELDWPTALDSILKKLERSQCKYLAFVQW